MKRVLYFGILIITGLATLFPPVKVSEYIGWNGELRSPQYLVGTGYRFLFTSGVYDFAVTRMLLQYLLIAVCFGLVYLWFSRKELK